MSVSASEKSRAAAISTLIRRDAGFRVTGSESTRDQGIRVRAAGRNGYPTIAVSDPHDMTNGKAESLQEIEYRRECIERALTGRGYTFETSQNDGEALCMIRVTGKDKPMKAAPKTHQARLSFEINLDAARQYLSWGPDEGDEASIALAMSESISEMIEVSNAANLGAIAVTRNEFVR